MNFQLIISNIKFCVWKNGWAHEDQGIKGEKNKKNPFRAYIFFIFFKIRTMNFGRRASIVFRYIEKVSAKNGWLKNCLRKKNTESKKTITFFQNSVQSAISQAFNPYETFVSKQNYHTTLS